MSKDLPEHASVVVIGGGVIGTSIAFHLAESGVTDVVLVERDELACGSTCKAAGGVRASFSNAANIAIGLRGLEVYSRFAQDYGQEIDFTRDGYLYLLSDQTNVEVFTESVALQNSLGVPSRMITPEEAKKISPLIGTEGMLAACWSPQDGKATPEAVVMGYAAAARRHGARIIRHCAVTDIESSGGAITAVVTAHGRIATNTVVCAAGAWSRSIGEMVGVHHPCYSGSSPGRLHRADLRAARVLAVADHRLSLQLLLPPRGQGSAAGLVRPERAGGLQPQVRTRGLAAGPG